MGMLRMGMQGVSATILNSRNTRKPLKKIQTPAPVPRNNAPVGSDRLILDLQTECYSIQPSRSNRKWRVRLLSQTNPSFGDDEGVSGIVRIEADRGGEA